MHHTAQPLTDAELDVIALAAQTAVSDGIDSLIDNIGEHIASVDMPTEIRVWIWRNIAQRAERRAVEAVQ